MNRNPDHEDPAPTSHGRCPAIFDRCANTVMLIDPDYRIVGFNQAYVQFAKANQGERIEQEWGCGRCVLDCLPTVIRELVKTHYDQAFAGEVSTYDYCCHSPLLYRKFRMRAYPYLHGTVVMEHALLIERALDGVLELDADTIAANYTNADGLIRQCCNCRKIAEVQHGRRWDYIQSLINMPMANVSHTICPLCIEELYPGRMSNNYPDVKRRPNVNVSFHYEAG
jgi:hypothetical protein